MSTFQASLARMLCVRLPSALFALAFVPALASVAGAQGFNIDVGGSNGPPSSSYGAASWQAGVWNTMTGNSTMSLVGWDGAATPVTLTGTFGANYSLWYDNPGTSGDDEKLMDDAHDGALSLDFAGLKSGEYLVYTYAWAPDSAAYLTNVASPGSAQPTQTVGGAWPNGFVQGITHAMHRVVVSNGSLHIDCSVASTYATVNGVQILPVPYINIDCGTGNDAPGDYRAATTQKGYWNQLDATALTVGPLINTSFNETQVSISLFGSHANFWFNNGATTGDDEYLMDDVQDLLPGDTQWYFSGLPPGSYRVTVYAWTPDFPQDRTGIHMINGALGNQVCGNSPGFGGYYVLGQTHVQDVVTIAPGGLAFGILAGGAGPSDLGSINGVQIEPAYAPTVYCTAKVNSLGCRPAIGADGVSSATGGGKGASFIVSVRNVINNKAGLFFYSNAAPKATPFQAGWLCVGTPIRRTIAVFSGGVVGPNDCSGKFSIDFNAFAVGALGGSPQSYLRVPGTMVCAQVWGRDNGFAAPNNTTLSNAVQFTIGP